MQRALERGMFRIGGEGGEGPTNMLAITRVAIQLAQVVHDLHLQGIVHLVRVPHY